ncbi:kinase-like protein [Choiromyces venosus 120613-1]|uniref:EKC/KEOPS complex subunit BUD32 n=1 Tax=Choiromyces venosus 120613-1 TaxID=1336337 RepID=A0A3N4JBH0_9PEZI|nr:kinase-like protein [Choiromyces venosus 120613-1]
MGTMEIDPPTPKLLIKQGAEAQVYSTTYLLPHIPALLKHRPSKPYRHPTLDARLTKHRCLSESRLLIRARSLGIPVPAVYFVDESRGEIFMEWITGSSVREVLDEVLAQEDGESVVDRMMVRVGAAVGALHAADIVHGDLTTSNIMVRNGEREEVVGFGEREVVLIDFGLGAVSTQDEDKAVDLYVLERAFSSTHPKAEKLFQDVLKSYEQNYNGAKVVLRRLQDVRMRGRKRSMIG